MKAKFKRFLRRAQVFFKSNAVPIVVCTTTVLTICIVAVSTFLSLNASSSVNPPDDGIVNTPVSSSDPVVFSSPLENVEIIRDYSNKPETQDSTTGIWKAHQAIDFAGEEDTIIKAVFKGKIEEVKNDMMEGMVVTLKINDTLKVVYKCLATEVQVQVGDEVETGQEIGKIGTNIMERVDGFHLHLEVYENEKLVDPNNYFSFSDK